MTAIPRSTPWEEQTEKGRSVAFGGRGERGGRGRGKEKKVDQGNQDLKGQKTRGYTRRNLER